MKYVIVISFLFYSFTHGLFRDCFKNQTVKMQELLENIQETNPYENITIELSKLDTLAQQYDHYLPKISRTVPAAENKHARWSLHVINMNSGILKIINPECFGDYMSDCTLVYRWTIKPLKPGIAQVRAQYHSEHKELEQTQEFSITITE